MNFTTETLRTQSYPFLLDRETTIQQKPVALRAGNKLDQTLCYLAPVIINKVAMLLPLSG